MYWPDENESIDHHAELQCTIEVPYKHAHEVPEDQGEQVVRLIRDVDDLLRDAKARNVELTRRDDNHNIQDGMPAFYARYSWNATLEDAVVREAVIEHIESLLENLNASQVIHGYHLGPIEHWWFSRVDWPD